MIDDRWSTMIDHPSSMIDHRSSIIYDRSSIINHRWSIIDHRRSIISGPLGIPGGYHGIPGYDLLGIWASRTSLGSLGSHSGAQGSLGGTDETPMLLRLALPPLYQVPAAGCWARCQSSCQASRLAPLSLEACPGTPQIQKNIKKDLKTSQKCLKHVF